MFQTYSGVTVNPSYDPHKHWVFLYNFSASWNGQDNMLPEFFILQGVYNAVTSPAGISISVLVVWPAAGETFPYRPQLMSHLGCSLYTLPLVHGIMKVHSFSSNIRRACVRSMHGPPVYTLCLLQIHGQRVQYNTRKTPSWLLRTLHL